jgi:hypothetical protein
LTSDEYRELFEATKMVGDFFEDPNPDRGLLRFLADDLLGAWSKGDIGEDLGWESEDRSAIAIRTVKVNDQIMTFYDPFNRNLFEVME